MLVTLPIARWAMLVRSGSTGAGVAAAARGCDACAWGSVAAEVTSAVRIRPVSTSPAMRPKVTDVITTNKRLSMAISCGSADVDLARRRGRHLRDGDGQDAVAEIRGNALAVDAVGEFEDPL